MQIQIPTPPSVNEMYIIRNVKGKTGRSLGFGYRKWRDAAKATVEAQWLAAGRPTFAKPLSIVIRVNIDHKSDLDNRCKAVLDLLGKSIPGIPDDRWIDSLTIIRDQSIEGALVTVLGGDR